MRGKIIQYNGTDGSGIIVANGKQHAFAIKTWRGDTAPSVNKTVDIVLEDDAISAVTPIGDDVLLKEKATQMGNKLGGMWNKAAASVQASRAASSTADEATLGAASEGGAQTVPATDGIPLVGSIRERYGITIPIAWFLFLLGTIAFHSVSMSIFNQTRGWSMFGIASLMSQSGVGGGGFVKFLLIIGYLSIGVPFFWRDRRAWLVLLLPLIAVLWGVFDVLHTMSSMGPMGRQMTSDIYHTGFGFWLSLIMAIILGVLAVIRFVRAK